VGEKVPKPNFWATAKEKKRYSFSKGKMCDFEKTALKFGDCLQ
jgi:hypothetical protein